MSKWVKFTAMYDHRWESGAETNYPEGTVAHVKDEVAKAAVAAGKAEEVEKPADQAELVADAEAASPKRTRLNG